MEYLIKDLIEKIAKRKKSEMDYFAKYQNEELKEPMLISSGKILEMDHMIHELREMINYNSKSKQS